MNRTSCVKCQFKSGDIVVTLVSEDDIERIPAGTQIKLLRPNGDLFWYGEGVVNRASRMLLVRTSNLQLLKG
jgi:hypothetical protein